MLQEEELKYLFNYFNSVNEYCKKNNNKFYLLIIPIKSRIYGEYMPKYFHKRYPDLQSRTNQFINYSKNKSDIKIIYPYEILTNNKTKGLLYYKSDTHWNDLGASLIYDELIQIIQKDGLKISPVDYKKYAKYEQYDGDIAKRLAEIFQYKDDYSYIKYDFENSTKILNPNKKYNLYMYRDSFTDRLIKFLSNIFKDTSFVSTYQIKLSDLKDADIVIFEMVERNLHKISENKIMQ